VSSLPSDAPSHDAFLRGARLFDRGAFFEAHEAWEERWLVETDAITRRFLQGLIQIAAGLHKLVVVGDRASASRLLAKGLAKLDERPAWARGGWVDRFRDEVRACAGAAAIGRFDAMGAPKIGE
jgi:predicted metal-dependent hydrolase